MIEGDEIEVFFDKSEGACYLESLVRSRQHLKGSPLLAKLDGVIELEIELAGMGAQKAKSEILKSASKDNLRPIK